MQREEVQGMKEVNGWLAPDEYEGCRNCEFLGNGPYCKKAAELKDELPVCPFWKEAAR